MHGRHALVRVCRALAVIAERSAVIPKFSRETLGGGGGGAPPSSCVLVSDFYKSFCRFSRKAVAHFHICLHVAWFCAFSLPRIAWVCARVEKKRCALAHNIWVGIAAIVCTEVMQDWSLLLECDTKLKRPREVFGFCTFAVKSWSNQ